MLFLVQKEKVLRGELKLINITVDQVLMVLVTTSKLVQRVQLPQTESLKTKNFLKEVETSV
jgi:hypothetical protein